MEFQEARSWLKQLGITVSLEEDYRPNPEGLGLTGVPISVFTRFIPPFAADEWLCIAQREGSQYIGGCCGQTSAIQDIVCGWFRDGGCVPLKELAEVAEMTVRHDGKGSFFYEFRDPLDQVLARKNGGFEEWSDLWYRLAVVWHLVKDHYAATVAGSIRTDMSPGDHAICTIDQLATALSFHRVFGRDKPLTSQEQANRTLILARLTSALRYVLKHVDELGAQTVSGWALVDLSKGEDVICENGYGFCLFDDLDQALRVVSLWMKNEAKYQGNVPASLQVRNRIGIRPMTVDLSCEKGPVFTGGLMPLPEVLPPYEEEKIEDLEEENGEE
jgi:hypothetical protein